MADVVLDIDGDSSGAERTLAKLTKNYEKLQQKLADLGKTGKKAGEEIESGFKSTSSQISSMAVGLVSTTAAMGVAVRVAGDWATEMARVKQLYQDTNKEIVKAVSSSGNLQFGAQIEKQLASIKGATRAQGLQAFGGISSGAPALSLDRQMALTREISPLAPTGQDLASIGNTAAKLAEFMPGKSANDITDLTMAARAKLGEDFGKVGGDEFMSSVAKLQAAGMPADRALAIGMAGAEANLPSKAINGVAAALYEGDPNAGKRAKTAEDRTKAAFYKLSPEARFAKLSGDKATAEAVLGAGGALNMSLIGDGKAQQAYLAKAQSGNFAQSQLADLQNFSAGQNALSQQGHATAMQPFELSEGQKSAQAQRARDFVLQKTADKSTWLQRYITGAGMTTAEFGTSLVGGNRTNAVLGAATGGALVSDEQANRQGMISPGQRKEFMEREDRMAKALEENTKHLAKNNTLMEGQNKQPTKKDVNINRHVDQQ